MQQRRNYGSLHSGSAAEVNDRVPYSRNISGLLWLSGPRFLLGLRAGQDLADFVSPKCVWTDLGLGLRRGLRSAFIPQAHAPNPKY